MKRSRNSFSWIWHFVIFLSLSASANESSLTPIFHEYARLCRALLEDFRRSPTIDDADSALGGELAVQMIRTYNALNLHSGILVYKGPFELLEGIGIREPEGGRFIPWHRAVGGVRRSQLVFGSSEFGVGCGEEAIAYLLQIQAGSSAAVAGTKPLLEDLQPQPGFIRVACRPRFKATELTGPAVVSISPSAHLVTVLGETAAKNSLRNGSLEFLRHSPHITVTLPLSQQFVISKARLGLPRLSHAFYPRNLEVHLRSVLDRLRGEPAFAQSSWRHSVMWAEHEPGTSLYLNARIEVSNPVAGLRLGLGYIKTFYEVLRQNHQEVFQSRDGSPRPRSLYIAAEGENDN